jgi:hypothetical protein
LETATTNAAGTATGAAISTAKWQPGSYTVYATYAGSGNCTVPQATGVLTVAAPGSAAAGAGSYPVVGDGTARMGFVVGKLPRSDRYAGGLTIAAGKTWQFAASVSSYTSTSATTGTLTGTGVLWWWNPAVNRGRGGWQLAAIGVAYTAKFTATTAKAAATFGITINYTPAHGQPATLPDSSPVPLINGGIWVAAGGGGRFF